MKIVKVSLCLVISALAFIIGCKDDKVELQVYSWSDYFDPELIQRFEEENNCSVVITTFDSNEAMYAKLKSGASGYDVIVPSSYLIPTLVKEGIADRIDHSQITNVVRNYDHTFDSIAFDKDITWSVPYACTYTGLMYDKKNVKGIDSWKDINKKEYFRRISLLDDVRELVGIGLINNGCSINSTNKNEIMEAAKYVASIRNSVRKFDSEAYKNDVANGSVWIGHGYSSDAAQVIISEKRDDIGFALPNEGFVVAWDEFVILKDANNKELAHKFIDFFYDDEVSYANMLYICSLVPIRSAVARMPQEYKDILIPKNLDKGQLLKGFTDDNVMEYYNAAFDVIKSTDN